MKNGDILCLENTRFHPEEEKNDKEFARKLAALGDIFVDDAFSAAHREHASNTAIVTRRQAARLSRPRHAGRARRAGARLRDARSIRWPRSSAAPRFRPSSSCSATCSLKVETLIIGGGMANTFLAAQGKAVGKSLCENDLIATARDIWPRPKRSARDRAAGRRRRGAKARRPCAVAASSRSTRSAQPT